MKKISFTLLFSILSFVGFSQTLQEKLFYTCKIWGVVKYYHSNVSTCGVNWDSVLIDKLPAIRTASTFNSFNDVLIDILNAAGPMSLSSSYFPDTLSPELKRNRNFSWFTDPLLRSDVTAILDTIKNNFRPHANCWVLDNFGISSTAGWLVFPHDSIMLDLNTGTVFPGQDQRLLLLFKYWNIIRYFNPYNYSSDQNWEDVLYNYVIPVTIVSTPEQFYLLLDKMSARLDDAHVEGLTYSTNFFSPPGYYKPKVRLKFLDGKYTVLKSAISGISPGDMIMSVDGKTITEWEDSLRQYTSAGNQSVFKRFICTSLLARKISGTTVSVVVKDVAGVDHTFSLNCVTPSSDIPFFFDKYYFTDSISSVKWMTLQCDIGYVNMANLVTSDVNSMYSAIKSKSAVIFDLRYGANGTASSIADLMFPHSTNFAKFQIPDVTYPGTFYWQIQFAGIDGNPEPYTGKVILLFDENTQSHLEWSCMVLESNTNVVKVGSQTAGADGNVSRLRFSLDGYTGFTTLGAFYPNGDSAQRIGISPDTTVTQTNEGIRTKRDIVLEKALAVGGCKDFLSLENKKSTFFDVAIYPNPATEFICVDSKIVNTDLIAVEIIDVVGKVRLQEKIINASRLRIDVNKLPPSVYIVHLKINEQTLITRFTKI